jgi:hypothetical protein
MITTGLSHHEARASAVVVTPGDPLTEAKATMVMVLAMSSLDFS